MVWYRSWDTFSFLIVILSKVTSPNAMPLPLSRLWLSCWPHQLYMANTFCFLDLIPTLLPIFSSSLPASKIFLLPNSLFFLCFFFWVSSSLWFCAQMDKYEVVKDLGAGNFGVARLLRHKDTKELVAMKYIERGHKVSFYLFSILSNFDLGFPIFGVSFIGNDTNLLFETIWGLPSSFLDSNI